MQRTASQPFKVILVGNATVGKTSLIRNLCKEALSIEHQQTVGLATRTVAIDVDKERVKLNLWDTAGSEDFRALVPLYAREAHVAIVVASAVDPISIQSIDEWANYAKEGSPNTSIILAINKQDLPPNNDVLNVELLKLESKYEHVLLVSAKTGQHVEDLFHTAARLAQVPRPDQDTVTCPLIGEQTAKPCC
jgi:small GTP-binding protein